MIRFWQQHEICMSNYWHCKQKNLAKWTAASGRKWFTTKTSTVFSTGLTSWRTLAQRFLRHPPLSWRHENHLPSSRQTVIIFSPPWGIPAMMAKMNMLSVCFKKTKTRKRTDFTPDNEVLHIFSLILNVHLAAECLFSWGRKSWKNEETHAPHVSLFSRSTERYWS